MKPIRAGSFVVAAVAALGPAALVHANVVGTRLSAVQLEKFTQTSATSFDDFAGRAVLVEYFAQWCPHCGAAVPHLNELVDKFDDRGLSVLCVTHEPKELTDAWVEKRALRAAYAFDPGGALQRRLEIGGFPHAVLVDPTGTIVWHGNPGGLKDETIEATIRGALPKPKWEWPREAAGALASLEQGEYASALAAARRLKTDQSVLERTILARIDAQVDRMKAAVESHDWPTAYDAAAFLKRTCGGLDAARAADGVFEVFRKDMSAKAMVEARDRLRELKTRSTKTEAERKELLIHVEKIAAAQAGSSVGKDAAAFAADLRKRIRHD